MAEMQVQSNNKQHRFATTKKLSIRVDLTPMVDLGFLLITFFIFTTSLAEPKALKLFLPAEKNRQNVDIETPASKTLSLILLGDNKIAYYNGLLNKQLSYTNYSSSGLRVIINKMQQLVAKQYGKSSETVILIKPTPESNYKNVVSVLDEMLINEVTRYVLMDVSTEEKSILKKNNPF